MALEACHEAMREHTDPQCKTLISQAMTLLLKAQNTDYEAASTMNGPRALAMRGQS